MVPTLLTTLWLAVGTPHPVYLAVPSSGLGWFAVPELGPTLQTANSAYLQPVVPILAPPPAADALAALAALEHAEAPRSPLVVVAFPPDVGRGLDWAVWADRRVLPEPTAAANATNGPAGASAGAPKSGAASGKKASRGGGGPIGNYNVTPAGKGARAPPAAKQGRGAQGETRSDSTNDTNMVWLQRHLGPMDQQVNALAYDPVFKDMAKDNGFAAHAFGYLDGGTLLSYLDRDPTGRRQAQLIRRLGFGNMRDVRGRVRITSPRRAESEMQLTVLPPHRGLLRALAAPISVRWQPEVPASASGFMVAHVNPGEMWLVLETVYAGLSPVEYGLLRLHLDGLEERTGRRVIEDVFGAGPARWVAYQHADAGVASKAAPAWVVHAPLARPKVAERMLQHTVAVIRNIVPKADVKTGKLSGRRVYAFTGGWKGARWQVHAAFSSQALVLASTKGALKAHLAQTAKKSSPKGKRKRGKATRRGRGKRKARGAAATATATATATTAAPPPAAASGRLGTPPAETASLFGYLRESALLARWVRAARTASGPERLGFWPRQVAKAVAKNGLNPKAAAKQLGHTVWTARRTEEGVAVLGVHRAP